MERLCQGLSIGDDFTGILYILFYMHFENIYVDPLKRGFCMKLRMIPSALVLEIFLPSMTHSVMNGSSACSQKSTHF